MRGYVALVLFPLSLPVIIGRRLRRRSISPGRRGQASIQSTEFEHRAQKHVGSLWCSTSIDGPLAQPNAFDAKRTVGAAHTTRRMM